MEQKTATLCRYVAGSNLYGLNTPESDLDIRGIEVNTEPAFILGTRRFDHLDKRQGEDDVLYYELRKWVTLLKSSNTQALEVLFMDESQFEILNSKMAPFRTNRFHLVDSKQFLKHLLGYMSGEKRLANGERRGKIGEKRANAVAKYSFSPKNFTQLFRLAYIGEEFFKYGRYPVNVKEYDKEGAFWEFLYSMKTTPEKWNKDTLNGLVDVWETRLKTAYENRQATYKFDEELANKLLWQTYMPYLLS